MNLNTSKSEYSVVIEPTKGWFSLRLKSLWEYRELLYFLTWRDVKVRYKQTLLGAVWSIIQPIFTMILFTIFFGKLAGVPSDNLPYPVFTFTALLPWQFFANSLSLSGNSLVANQELISKVYFPRLIIPAVPIFAGLVDFGVAFIVLLGIMFYYEIFPSLLIFTVPLFLFLAALTSLSISLWISALNVKYRDVQYIIPFLIQFWLFATPIAYPLSIVPEQLKFFYNLNPMVAVVEGFRWALLNKGAPPDYLILISFIVTLIFLMGGLIYFRRMEKIFADVV
ncbi:MAG TPA: ABC transporter permease [Ignavibacteriaceae bacterium]|nr:ABC transporter permease [Ignavibacteriaceae bacterium]